MKPVDVIIPTLNKPHAIDCFKSLQFMPMPINVHVVTEGDTWAKAINIGLSQTSGQNDVVLMDDDVIINKGTLAHLPYFYNDAEIFGFKLLFPDGSVQHAGGAVSPEGALGHIGFKEKKDTSYLNDAYYVCHATTSLIYIKRGALNALKGMAEDIPGVQMEDVDFNFRALKAGFRILYIPDEAIHMESATKKTMTNFWGKINEAHAEITKRHLGDPSFLEKVRSYPKIYDRDKVCV